MATTVENFVVRVNAQGVDQLDKIRDRADGARSAVMGLGDALVGIGFAAFINGALQTADAVGDLSDATGIGLGQLKALEIAMSQAGGEAEGLGKAIGTFSAAIEEANGGSQKMRDTFAQVGVSMEDLRTLSETDLLRKSIEGLSRMEAGSQRTAVAVELFSRAFRSVDPARVQELMAAADFDTLERETKAAADAAQALNDSYKNLQEGAIRALEPILQLMGEKKLSVEAATTLITALGVAIGITYGARAVAALIAFGKALAGLNLILKAQVALQAAVQALQGPKGWAILAGSAVAATAAIAGLNKVLDENAKKSGATGAPAGGIPTPSGTPTTPRPANRTQLETPEQKSRREAQARELESSQRRIAESLANASLAESVRGVDEETKIKIQAQAEIARRSRELDANTNLSARQRAAELAAYRQEVLSEADTKIFDLRKRLQEEADRELKRQQEEEERRLAQIAEQMKRARQMSDDVVGTMEKENQRLQERMDLETAIQGLSRIDQELMLAKYNATVRNQDAFERIKELRDAGLLTEGEYLDYQTRSNAELERQNALLEEQARQRKRRLEDSRAGVASVLTQMEEMTQPFNVAADMTSSLFNNMNSALDTFVRTGKFKFKDFARSVIQDLIAIQLRAAATKLLSSVIGSIFGIPGRASGGPVQAQEAYVVGEKGPELFVPKHSGLIVPNEKLKKYLAPEASIPGRAAGGPVMANMPYMVGERGPELFVPKLTPALLGAGISAEPVPSTTVNYNIQAVDAASFRQLVARDPEFIYAVTQKGSRSLPGRR